ncbi:hypothetical protein E1162_15770 [Rhodobacteraceae bacterium RKSG542]|uniref:glyoxalase superfamily protein n=1 Tax=Pseudovibrio flavus TaxID=2529854 RepID=UPI0012BCCA81|nr:glyoxalase superfamily protein [Pseudovibrio flavus]MTI18703.1 hypothetical protein [Pseudovibrio flavus]
MTQALPTLTGVKTQAKRLRTSLADQGTTVSHSQSLELVSKQHGYRDWNTFVAAIGDQSPVFSLTPGARVNGTYLGQAFTGKVVSASLQTNDRTRLSIQLDQPVDVVSFDSFSSFRSRINATVNPDGKTTEKRSDGEPHLELDLASMN